LVIRLRSLGDCVLTTPAIALLKAYRPDLRIGVLVEPRFAGVFEDNPDVEEILNDLPDWRPTFTLNFHGGTRSMVLTFTSLARFRAGFGHHRYRFIYSHQIPRAQQILGEGRPVHTAEHLASAMFWLGVPRTEIPRAKLMAPTRAAMQRTPPSPAYAVYHAFASAEGKAWPVERFAEVARHIQRERGLEPLFLAGPTDDTSSLGDFQVLKNAPLGEVKTVMAGASLFIGNDSGPAHIAAAFGVPVVVLFGPSNPVTWAPWRTEAQVLTSAGSIQSITTAQVLDAASKLKIEWKADAKADLNVGARP
jgi:ADP-heptose:LPS heptosyltransferase